MHDYNVLVHANQLLANNNFNEVLDVISEYIDEGNHLNEAYILKAKALEGLGRIGEAHEFFWLKINWRNPSKNDLEMVKLTEKAALANNSILVFHRLNYMYNIMSQWPKSNVNKEDESKVRKNLRRLESNPNDYENFLSLAWLYLAQNDYVKSTLYLTAYRYFCQNPIKADELDCDVVLSSFVNTSDIYMYLSQESSDTFAFVIEREEDAYEYEKMAKTLSLMNKNVFILPPEISFDLGNREYDIEYFLNLSYDNIEVKENIKYCTPIQLTNNGTELENTTFPLLNRITKNTNNHLPLFAERSTLDNLKSRQVSRKEIHYVCNGFDFKNENTCTCFAYIRGYERYISKLYNVNVSNQLTAESECAFSIIVPVRNNVNTLHHTLKACMEQSFNDYEIVISDNSDDGNNSVYDLVNKLESEKIKYYKTPRKLPLSKSFEYAYLKARGDFLVPIGAKSHFEWFGYPS